MGQHSFVTVVVGAGPAGLLFSLVAAIRAGDSQPAIVLVDKRVDYERSHRLRMDRRPYLIAQESLDHPLYDELITFLDAENFRPAANHLESTLLGLVGRLGIDKHQLTVGGEAGELGLVELRHHLEGAGVLAPGGRLMVVGADSVKSSIRTLVADPTGSVERVHQTVARLRIDGESLPSSLDPIRQLKVAKLLGSAIDYRFNQNGFAEIDLFLSPEEHRMVEGLGARPADPIVLTSSVLDVLDAPLFASVVDHLVDDLGPGPNVVSIHSTFRLEHRYQKQVAYLDPLGTEGSGIGGSTAVFLVGDAAVSLPFFRGMACLMACADELASVHTDLAQGTDGPVDMHAAVARYNQSVDAIRKKEVATVETRARAVSVARELVRISSMAPFPMQTWLLSIRSHGDRPSPRPRFTKTLAVTIVLLTLAALLAMASPVLGLAGLLSIPVQAGAGALYRSDLASPRRPNPAVAVACRLQVLVLTVAGLVVALFGPFGAGWWIRLGAAVGWWVLGLCFVAGMYLYEELASRSRSQSSLETSSSA